MKASFILELLTGATLKNELVGMRLLFLSKKWLLSFFFLQVKEDILRIRDYREVVSKNL
jgi:hypothetical protein